MWIWMYSLVVVMLTCPSQDLIRLSWSPDWSRCRAVVWRLCGIPHKRHSRAMHLYEAGVPLPYIRDIFFFNDTATTEIYARASTEAKRKALEAAYDIVTDD